MPWSEISGMCVLVRSKKRSAERFLYFLNLAERMSARGKSHGLVWSGYPPLNMLRSGYPLAGKVTDFHRADIRRYKCHGLLRSGYPSHGFFHGAVHLTPVSKPHKTTAFPHGAP